MTLLHQVIRQPADEEVEQVISAEVPGCGSPERRLAQDGAKARIAFNMLLLNGGPGRLPALPRRDPQKTGEPDGQE